MTIGEVLGNYNILGRLSSGGMGEVYLAEDTKLHRKVALKVLPAEWSNDPDRLKRFQWEAQVLATLNHPNIVTIFAVEEQDNLHFFTMELVEGQTLSEVIPEGGLDLEAFLELAVPLADALAAAHQNGLIHRDLKPGNVMVSEDRRLKVLDFGLAKREREPVEDPEETLEALPNEPRTQDGRLLGTVAYMAPEQMAGRVIDHRADLFSLGIVLYEMITGVRPFEGSNWAQLITAHMSEKPTQVAEAQVPKRLTSLIERCLRKDPEDRIYSAADIRDELRSLQFEYVSGSYSSTQIVRPVVPRSPKRYLVGAAAVLVALIVAWQLKLFSGWNEPEDSFHRLVVLPFESLGDADDEYFAVGVTEEITSRLASASALKVISRSTAQQYDRGDRTSREIGEELNVDYLLEGTVRWSNRADGPNLVRVTPRLIQVSDDTQLWSDSYERVIDDIFAVQSEIAAEVMRQLDIALLETEESLLTDAPTRDLDAYDAYLRGMDYATRLEPKAENWELAVRMLERAVRLDPDFGLAYAELSRAHSFLYKQAIDQTESRLQMARAAAERALELDPDRPDGHRALGYYYYWVHSDYDRALEEFEIAAARLPNDSQLIEAFGYIRRRQGLFNKAVEHFAAAMELNPRSSWLAAEFAHTYSNMRRFEEAEELFNRAIAAAPDQPHPYQLKATNTVLWTGDVAQAQKVLDEMPRQEETSSLFTLYRMAVLARDYPAALEILQAMETPVFRLESMILPRSMCRGFVHGMMGEEEKSRKFYENALLQLERRVASNDSDPRLYSALGLTYAALGREEEAVTAARRAVELYPVSRDALVGPDYISHLSIVYARVGELDAAVDQLEYLLSIPAAVSLPYLRINPRWDPLRGHPRFERLLTGDPKARP